MIRVGVVGYGHWGPNFTRILADRADAELAFICDASAARCRVAAENHPTVRVTTELGAALQALDRGAVVVATPAETHAAITGAALAAGNHVLVEKPLGMNAAEVETMIDAATTGGLTLMVDHTYLFSDGITELRAAVSGAGRGGPLTYRSRRTNPARVAGPVGVLRDLAVHDLAILDALHDAPPLAASALQIEAPPGVDLVELRLTYADGSAAEVTVGWGTGDRSRQVVLASPQATVTYDDRPPASGEREPLQQAVAHFLRSIANGEPPLTDGASARRVARVLDAGSHSLASVGSTVTLGELEALG